MAKKKLSLAGEEPQKLGQDTIMDRALAERHGAPYVHLAAFAIDVDRVLQADPDVNQPFGWEVLLTEAYVHAHLDAAANQAHCGLLEDVCLSILERPSGDSPLGGQLVFAVYTGVARGKLPESLNACFDVWKKPPRDLAKDVSALWADPEMVSKLARYCLGAPVRPPLVSPVQDALEKLA